MEETKVHPNKGRKRPDLSLRNKSYPNKVHGLVEIDEHNIWTKMKKRCNNHKCKDYAGYGARGIKVCPTWLGNKRGEGFLKFITDMGLRPSKFHQLDRIDNDKGYSYENCRWATSKENNRHRRSSRMITFNGYTKCISQWAEDLKIERKCLEMRIRGGWTLKRALTTPYIARKGKAK